jgi:predicted membrane-bound spermidine synthase
MDLSRSAPVQSFWQQPVLLGIFFISGFTALLYQVVWQRMLGLFSGSDVRSISVVVASYLVGLGLGSLLGGWLSDHLTPRRAVQIYGLCDLGVAAFALLSRFLFYDLLFQQCRSLASSSFLMLLIVFVSLLIPTTLMGLSFPLLANAISQSADQAASHIGLLYGFNTLGSGLGALSSGWYLVGTLGYESTLHLGAALSGLAGFAALASAGGYTSSMRRCISSSVRPSLHPYPVRSLMEWCVLVFCSGFVAIALEILWFRVFDIALQSIAYTYAHMLAFVLVSNALGSVLGVKLLQAVHHPRRVFLWIQGLVVAYSAIALWLTSWVWQSYPGLRSSNGYIDPHHIDATIWLTYGVLPTLLLVPPNLLLGVYVPLIQKAVQVNDQQIGWRVGLIQVINILGNTAGSLLTGGVLLDQFGTANSMRLLMGLSIGFLILLCPTLRKPSLSWVLVLALVSISIIFPSNVRLWAALHGIPPQDYFILAEDSTGVAAITESNHRGTLLASGQAQANFPYLQVHALLGTIPALLHPHPAQIMMIGLGSGGTPHTIGANPLTQDVRVVELIGTELRVLQEYAKTEVGKPLQFLFQDSRYTFVAGDGRRDLTLADRQFDIIEADAIQPWRSRAGMLYSQEFFQEVRSHLAPGGISVQWNVNPETVQTFRNVFPYVIQLDMSHQLSLLIGSDRHIDFDRERLLSKLDLPDVIRFLTEAGVNIAAIRKDIKTAVLQAFSHVQDGQPLPVNTDLFPRSEYYLNHPMRIALRNKN